MLSQIIHIITPIIALGLGIWLGRLIFSANGKPNPPADKGGAG